jgi:hypothetical protein
MHISVQTRAVGHEKVISYPKRRDGIIFGVFLRRPGSKRLENSGRL